MSIAATTCCATPTGPACPTAQLRPRLALAQPAFAPPTGQRRPASAIDGAKGIVSLESFILARLFMFQQVYFHKATRAAEWMIRAIFAARRS